jgi:hypothetical protein
VTDVAGLHYESDGAKCPPHRIEPAPALLQRAIAEDDHELLAAGAAQQIAVFHAQRQGERQALDDDDKT